MDSHTAIKELGKAAAHPHCFTYRKILTCHQWQLGQQLFWCSALALISTGVFFLPIPGTDKTFLCVGFSELSPRNLSFLKSNNQGSRNINSSIRKLAFLSLFENDLLLCIASQWLRASQSLKADNIWPHCQNNCQQVPMDSFTGTPLASHVCSQQEGEANGCKTTPEHELFISIFARKGQRSTYKDRPSHLSTWKVMLNREKRWVHFSSLFFFFGSLEAGKDWFFFPWFQNLSRFLTHQILKLIQFPKHTVIGFDRSDAVNDFIGNCYIQRDTEHVLFQSQTLWGAPWVTWASLTLQIHDHNVHSAFNTCTQTLCAVLNRNNCIERFSFPIIISYSLFLQKHLRKLFASPKHKSNNPEMDKKKVTFTCRNSSTRGSWSSHQWVRRQRSWRLSKGKVLFLSPHI